MKKFVAMMTAMVMMILVMSNTALAVEEHRIEYLFLDDSFMYHDDQRLSVDGFVYEGNRQDLYIYVGNAFKVRVSNVEDHDVVRIDYIRTTETIDVIWQSDTYSYEEAVSNDICMNTNFETMFQIMFTMMEQNGWD